MAQTCAPPFILIGNPGSRRVEGFQAALAQQQLPPARVLSWNKVLRGEESLWDAVSPNSTVRIESPGQDWEVEKLLLSRGVEAIEKENQDSDFDCLSHAQIAKIEFQRGRIWPSRQWYLGFCQALGEIEAQLNRCPPHQALNNTGEIMTMFDKPRCHALLQETGIPVAKSLDIARCFDELVALMRRDNIFRVFVKPAHGSSASGVVAYQTDGRRHRAVTTTEMVRQGGEVQLFNSRRVRIYEDWSEIAQLFDALCRHRVHVEQWMPKAGVQGKTCDLRIVVIGGQAQHTVVRLSHHPLTNLHLLNERAGLEVLQSRLSPEAWQAAQAACEAVMKLFPRSLMAGVDLLLSPDFRRHAILEVNAFGDWLPGCTHEGIDTHTAQILRVPRPAATRSTLAA